MWKRELVRNKIYAVIFIVIGVASVLIENNATFLALALMLGVPLFFSKENWIYEGADKRQRPKKKCAGVFKPGRLRSDEKCGPGRRTVSHSGPYYVWR